MSLIYNEHNEFFHLCQHVPGLWPVSAPMRPKNKPQIQWFYHQFPDEDSHEDSYLGVYPGIVGEKLEQTHFLFGGIPWYTMVYPIFRTNTYSW
jgi:hypothetical protein